MSLKVYTHFINLHFNKQNGQMLTHCSLVTLKATATRTNLLLTTHVDERGMLEKEQRQFQFRASGPAVFFVLWHTAFIRVGLNLKLPSSGRTIKSANVSFPSHTWKRKPLTKLTLKIFDRLYSRYRAVCTV
jgi:hypothetical protein